MYSTFVKQFATSIRKLKISFELKFHSWEYGFGKESSIRKSFTQRNVSHALTLVKFGKQRTLEGLLNNLWNSHLMETYVIITGFQSACKNNTNTIYGIMRSGNARTLYVWLLVKYTSIEKGWKGHFFFFLI